MTADRSEARAGRIRLELIEVESPCKESWASMQGDDRVRRCSRCRQDVFDLSAMTRDEAESLVAGASRDGLCARFLRRADGTVVTTDCAPLRLALARKAARRSLALAAAMAAAIAASFAGVAWLLGSEPLCDSRARAGSVVDRLASALADKVDRYEPEYELVQGGI